MPDNLKAMPAEEARVVDKVRLKLVGFESGLGLSVGRPNLSFETCNINTVKYTLLMHLSKVEMYMVKFFTHF